MDDRLDQPVSRRTEPVEWRYRPGFLSDAGRVRERNEDGFELYVPEPGAERTGRAEAFFAVADGMGGHAAGDVASEVAIRSLRAEFHEPAADGESLEAWLDALFRGIHERLREAGREAGDGRGMGSTLTVAMVDDESLVVAHVGDSRLYRLREGVLERITEDHSWVAEQIRQGLLTEEEAERHADRNVLTRCLGIGVDPEVFHAREEIRHGDRYLLSSDGLHGEVDAETLARVLIEEGNPQDAARRLVGLADEAGSPDNVTVVVFDTLRRSLGETAVQPVAPTAPSSGGRRGVTWVLAGGALVLLAGLVLGARAFVRPGAEPPSPVAADTLSTAAVDTAVPPAGYDSIDSFDSIDSIGLHHPNAVDGTTPSPTAPESAATTSASQGEDDP